MAFVVCSYGLVSPNEGQEATHHPAALTGLELIWWQCMSSHKGRNKFRSTSPKMSQHFQFLIHLSNIILYRCRWTTKRTNRHFWISLPRSNYAVKLTQKWPKSTARWKIIKKSKKSLKIDFHKKKVSRGMQWKKSPISGQKIPKKWKFCHWFLQKVCRRCSEKSWGKSRQEIGDKLTQFHC